MADNPAPASAAAPPTADAPPTVPPAPHPFAATRLGFAPGPDKRGELFSLPALGRLLGRDLSRLPVTLRIVLEALLRHCDGQRVTPDQVVALAGWQPVAAAGRGAVPFSPARLLLHDGDGLPLLAALAAQRDAAVAGGGQAASVQPQLPVDLVVDASRTAGHWGSLQAQAQNLHQACQQQAGAYRFLQWADQVLPLLAVVPPGFGNAHQLNLDGLARGVCRADKARGQSQLHHPDTLLGTDGSTAMANALGVLAWAVAPDEAAAVLAGQPLRLAVPDVVGVLLTGRLGEGVTATDLALTLTDLLRGAGVAGQFVEFLGDGAAGLTVPDRATIAALVPASSALLAHFPVDAQTVAHLRATGRARADVAAVEAYFRAQGLFGMPQPGQIDHSRLLVLDLASVGPCVAGLGGQGSFSRLALGEVPRRFHQLLGSDTGAAGQAPDGRLALAVPAHDAKGRGPLLQHGEVLAATLDGTACAGHPGLMLAAGLLARNAVARGLAVAPHRRTTLAPGSRALADVLDDAGLLKPLRKLGFFVVGHGDGAHDVVALAPAISAALDNHGLLWASVRAAQAGAPARQGPGRPVQLQASPALVVAYALAGTLRRDLATEPLGQDPAGRPVFLRELWPADAEVQALLKLAHDPGRHRKTAVQLAQRPGLAWKALRGSGSPLWDWTTPGGPVRPPLAD